MKGQAWAEYIVILAVVVMIAGVAMYVAGAFMGKNQQISERDSATYWVSSDVGIIRYNVNSSLSQLVIKNNKNFRINVTGISTRGSGSLVAPGGATSIILDAGQSAQVNVTGLNCSYGAYSLFIVINYSDVNYGTRYVLYGEKPLVGSCMGSTALQPAPECISDSNCGSIITPCNMYCNISLNQLCRFTISPVTCQRTCVNQKCQDCSASCGNPSCISCGINTTNCPAAFCNGDQNCTYPQSTSCSIPCPVDACGSCTPPACVATCTNCPPAAQLCVGNGNCVVCNNNSTCDTSFGENYTNCPQDCCRGGTYACSDTGGTCHSACSGFNCTNFMPVCENQPWSASRCSNLTGGSTGSLDYYVGCCNATPTYCGDGYTCNQTSPATTSCIPKTVYYQSNTNLCGYYKGTSESCGSVNTICNAHYYAPQQTSCLTTAVSCTAETSSLSCAVCGDCTGTGDTCNNATCGSTYGCTGGVCNGGKGAGSCNAPFGIGVACNCSQQCASGVCSGGLCVAYYSNTSSLCGYYFGNSSTCTSNPSFNCAQHYYFPSTGCITTTSIPSCTAESYSASCAACGDCNSGTCGAVSCGTSNSYGCSNVCDGQGTGLSHCATLGGTGATCYCNQMCTSGACNMTSHLCLDNYTSGTNQCGYYKGTSCSATANNYCTVHKYYPTQLCSSAPTNYACIAEGASGSCAVCGDCAGGADTCNNATCGTTNNYGCVSGMYCNGGKGAGSCNSPFATGAACNCSAQCQSGSCNMTSHLCLNNYTSGTNQCGYYKGTSCSTTPNNYCTSAQYYPAQSCSATPTYTSCQTADTTHSCGSNSVCGMCSGTADTCGTATCGTTYGCSGGKVCNGRGKGASYCVAKGGTGATCYCGQMCTSGVCRTNNRCQ